MATTSGVAAADVIDPPTNRDPPASERQLGLTMTTALVIGNMIGAGIFLMPAELAPFGPNVIYGWLVTVGGALFLAATLAILSAHIEGGPFVYVEEAFGAEVSFIVMWSYVISLWTANASLAIAAVSNLSHLVPEIGTAVTAPLTAIGFVWVIFAVNATGARTAGLVQLITTVLKSLPLVAVVIVAIVYLGRGTAAAQEAPVAVSSGSIASAAALAMFAMLGIESAVISTDKIKSPRRTIPIASVVGAALTGAIYIAATAAVLYLLPANQAAASPSPFADAAQPLLGQAAGSAVAAFAGISALGCLNGWILCSGEVPLKLARDGAFPAWFAKTRGRGTPVRAQFIAAALGTVLIGINYSSSMARIFALLSLVSVVATLALYTSCSGAALVLLARRRLNGVLLGVCALVGLLFSFWTYWGAGKEALEWGAVLLATGFPVWLAVRRGRRSTLLGAVAPAAPPG